MADKNWGQNESGNIDPFHKINKSVRHFADGSKLFSPETHKDRDNPGETIPKYLCQSERDFNCLYTWSDAVKTKITDVKIMP